VILLLFVHLVDLPHSIHQPASAFPLFLLAQASRAMVKAQGICQIFWCPQCAFDCLMPLGTPYLHIAQLLHLSDDISWGICGIHVAVGLWKNFAVGEMALTERGDLFELWNQVKCFLLAVEPVFHYEPVILLIQLFFFNLYNLNTSSQLDNYLHILL